MTKQQCTHPEHRLDFEYHPVHARGLCQHHYDQTAERLAHFRAKHAKDPFANYKRTVRRLRQRIREKEEQLAATRAELRLYVLRDFREHEKAGLYDPASEQRRGYGEDQG